MSFCIFNCLYCSFQLPANARNDMREAYRAAVELLKKKGIYNEDEAKAGRTPRVLLFPNITVFI